jgi:hypothetical protein
MLAQYVPKLNTPAKLVQTITSESIECFIYSLKRNMWTDGLTDGHMRTSLCVYVIHSVRSTHSIIIYKVACTQPRGFQTQKPRSGLQAVEGPARS